MKQLWKNNSLSIVFSLLSVTSLVGQVFTGRSEYNQQQQDLGGTSISLGQYLHSGHFIQATFENFESEFLQMALFVVLTIFLYQKGSSESKDPDKAEEVDRPIDKTKGGAPWPVLQGGLPLALYKHSLSIALSVLFAASFIMHFYGSLTDYNQEQLLKGHPTDSAGQYFTNSRFWFESFQNWQSEFLSVLAIVVLTIFLRQKGSPQSKPVDQAHSATGE